MSDVHVDFEVNARWVGQLSAADFRDDILILAGDVADSLPLLRWCLDTLVRRFRAVLFVPGNHDLWVRNEDESFDSLDKFRAVAAAVKGSGASMKPLRMEGVTFVPLLGWYDYSFGDPDVSLRSTWMDYRFCRWPQDFGADEIAAHFDALNPAAAAADDTVISFSHFVPRIDVMPSFIPPDKRKLYPVLGSSRLERQIRLLGSDIHVYGHSHVNRDVVIDGVRYFNNAFAYPNETHAAAKRLVGIYETR